MIFFSVWLGLLFKDPSGSQRGVFPYDSHDWFMDWFNVVYYSIGKKPYIWGLIEERSLPPLTFLLLYPFSLLYDYDVTGWIENDTRYEARYAQLPMVGGTMVLILSYLLLAYALNRAYRSRKNTGSMPAIMLFLVLFFSGINLFCIERMNLQVITAGSLALYTVLCETALPDEGKGNPVDSCLCMLCLSFAAAIKLFPAIFGVLLLYKKKWKEAAAAFITGMLLVFLPFLWMDQPFIECITSFVRSLKLHGESYLTIADFGFSTPMLIGLTGLDYGLLQAVAYIAAVIALCCAWSLKSGWKKIMLLSLTLVLTSGQQGYYCLMFLFLPIVLFFTEEHSLIDVAYVAAFAVILSPLQRTAHIGAVDVSARGVINLVLLLLYLELIVESVIDARNNKGR